MPADLVEAGRKQKCDQISDFYAHPGPVDPPYRYGYLAGEERSSAVFWCKPNPTENLERPYALILVALREDLPPFDCPTRLLYWNGAAGLTIEQINDLPLQEFGYVDEPQKSLPETATGTGPMIVSARDGVVTRFFCYEHRWAYEIRD